MDKCREAFEQLPEIKIHLHNVKYDEEMKTYHPQMAGHLPFEFSAWYLNGAWSMWQSRKAELDQAYADIETFAQALQRECDIKVQIANELKEKDKRIEEILFVIARAKDGYYGYSKDGGDTDNLVFDLEKALGDNNANS